MSSLPPRRSDDRGGPSADYRPVQKSNNALWIVLIVAAICLVALCLISGILAALLLPAVQQAREAARRTQATNELKIIGLGAHNFHDVHGHFPPLSADGSQDPGVTSPISFHTSLLPYIDQQTLYGGIDKSIPWNDPANQMSYSMVVPTFLSPQYEEKTAPNGYALTHFVPSVHLIRDGKPISMREVTDGTSNTVLAGQINAAFPAWGDPDNARDPAAGLGGGPNAFGGKQGGGLILMMDGSARFVSQNVAPGVLQAIATPDGGEVVGDF